jgi:hypothetical protein
MLLIIFLGLIATLTLVSGKCDVGTQNMDDFNWTKVRVNLFTRIVKEVAVVTLLLFPMTKPQYKDVGVIKYYLLKNLLIIIC